MGRGVFALRAGRSPGRKCTSGSADFPASRPVGIQTGVLSSLQIGFRPGLHLACRPSQVAMLAGLQLDTPGVCQCIRTAVALAARMFGLSRHTKPAGFLHDERDSGRKTAGRPKRAHSAKMNGANFQFQEQDGSPDSAAMRPKFVDDRRRQQVGREAGRKPGLAEAGTVTVLARSTECSGCGRWRNRQQGRQQDDRAGNEQQRYLEPQRFPVGRHPGRSRHVCRQTRLHGGCESRCPVAIAERDQQRHDAGKEDKMAGIAGVWNRSRWTRSPAARFRSGGAGRDTIVKRVENSAEAGSALSSG